MKPTTSSVKTVSVQLYTTSLDTHVSVVFLRFGTNKVFSPKDGPMRETHLCKASTVASRIMYGNMVKLKFSLYFSLNFKSTRLCFPVSMGRQCLLGQYFTH